MRSISSIYQVRYESYEYRINNRMNIILIVTKIIVKIIVIRGGSRAVATSKMERFD